MESALVPVPALDRYFFDIQQINSLSVIEPVTSITSDIFNSSNQLMASPRPLCPEPNIFELTPLHETKYK
jgi:hypothetical protein